MIKNQRIWRKIILSSLILLSIILSALLFSAGGHLGEGVTDLTNIASNQPSPSVVERDLTKDVYRPVQTVLHTPSEHNTKYVVNDVNISNEIIRLVNEVQLREVNEKREMDHDQYQILLMDDEWLELVFQDEIPLGIYSHLFENLPKDYAEQTFDRIFMRMKSPTELYFYNYKQQMLYRVAIDKRPTDTMPSIEELDAQVYTAFGVALNNRWVYLPTDAHTVGRKSYMIERLSNSLYINQFFKDTSSVESRTSGHVTRYIDLTKEVTINEENQTLSFLSQQASNEEISLTQRLRSSYDTLNRFENWQDDVIYQSYQADNNYVTYQRYIDGYPVFSNNQYESTVEIATIEVGLTHLRLPLRFIRTPISINEDNERTLISGTEVIEKIQEAGYSLTENIQDIKIGLAWVQSSENENVIFFEPKWFVKNQNRWLTLDQLLNPEEDNLSAAYTAKGGRSFGF